jgi:serine/threonine-protein kinase
MVPSVPVPAPASNRGAIFGGVGLAAALAIGYLFTQGPSTGSLAVSVSGPGGKALSGVVVTVDDAEACEEAICEIKDLEKGSHRVSARAEGFEESATKLVSVQPGEEAVLNIELTPANAGTGLEIDLKAPGLTLTIDGKTVGKLPQEVSGLEPGDHTVELSGSKLYKPFKETVSLRAGEMLRFEPELKLEQGQLTINLGEGAKGAKIRLEGGGKTFVLHGKEFPLTINIPADKTFTLTATRDGYEDFEEEIEFSVEKPQKTVEIELDESDEDRGDSSGSRSRATPRSSSSSSSRRTSSSSTSRAPSGAAKLNINSIPVSNVLLDGRPLGSTPKIGLSVSPGTHTVVFVHPEKGRKVKTVTVAAGGTATAVVRF